MVDGHKMIGLKFYPDKVIHSLVKSIPGIKWSSQLGMAYCSNTQVHLNTIYTTFKGVAWVDGKYFFRNRPIKDPVLERKQFTLKAFQERKHTDG